MICVAFLYIVHPLGKNMIIVFGSLNIDMMLPVKALPREGETVLSKAYDWMPGGKGFNQAVACRRAGADRVAMIGHVGDDGFGVRLMNIMKNEGLVSSGMGHSDDLPTGCAVVTYTPDGKNSVVVSQGANLETTAEQVPDEVLTRKSIVLLQMEIDSEQNVALIDRASERGAKIVLNLAPVGSLPDSTMKKVDYLLVNELEATQIAKKSGMNIDTDSLKLATLLARAYDCTCIVTLGADGAVASTGKIGWEANALNELEILDSTGAGDAFCGAFVTALAEEQSLPEALRYGCITGSLACTKVGAQSSLPFKATILDHIDISGDVRQKAV